MNSKNGSTKWKVWLGEYIASPTSIADFDGDKKIETFVISGKVAYLISCTGEIIWSFQLRSDVFRGGAISDIDCDGNLDIIFGSNDGKVFALKGIDGIKLFEFDVGDDWAGEHSPVIADFNKDGKLDIFFIAGKSFQDQRKNYGFAYAITFMESIEPGWYMFRGNPYHSGQYYKLEEITYKCLKDKFKIINF